MAKAHYQEWLQKELFEQAPLNIAVIDPDYRIVSSNRNFENLFGEAGGRRCYEVQKGRDEPCENCTASQTWLDGRVRVNEESGVDKSGRAAHYLVYLAPIFAEDGSIPYIIEMSADITESKRLKSEYQTLFEQVPCYVTVLNRDLRVVRANQRFREKFGEISGQKCFELFKRQTTDCANCPAKKTFADGKIHRSEQVGSSKDGEPTYYMVTTAPLSRGDEDFSHVIEMAVDVTDLRHTEERLQRARVVRRGLVEHSPDAIVGIGTKNDVLIFNPAAESLFGIPAADVLGRALQDGFLPPELEELVNARRGECRLESAVVRARSGEEIPVRLSGYAVAKDDEYLGTAAFVKDLREVRRLEKEKLDAERLTAVGQTVAGLAHGIKNLLTGLEGGVYFLRSGLEGDRTERIQEGWGMLQRNVERISVLVRNLLSFSKGGEPNVEVTAPEDLVRDVVDLYREAAAREDVVVSSDIPGPVAPAPLDPEAIHTCLANLVSNAVDACQMSDKRPCCVQVRVRDEDDNLVFEVEDEGCGMDQEVRKFAFTNFFTTKGKGGTGLGLLLTRKMTQEHGGRIAFESEPGKGSTFRLIFPRERLRLPDRPEQQGDSN